MELTKRTAIKPTQWLTIFGLVLVSTQGWGLTLVSSSGVAGGGGEVSCASIFRTNSTGIRTSLRMAVPLAPVARVDKKIPFGTGKGRNMAPAPVSVTMQDGMKINAYIERQKHEENTLLILTYGEANRPLNTIELPSESASGVKPLPTKNGTFLAVFGDSLVGRDGGEEFFVIEPLTGKIREFLLPPGAKRGRVLFPQVAGEPLLAYNGKNSFEIYDTTFMKKIGQWELPQLSREDFETTILARVPGQKDRVLLLSDHKVSMVNTTSQKIEWSLPGNFTTNTGVAETSQGPVLYRADFSADPQTGRQSVHVLSLHNKVPRSFEIGDGNVIVNGIEIMERGDSLVMTILTKQRNDTSELTFINLSSGDKERQITIPSTVSQMKLQSLEEGAEPVLLLSRPGYLPLDKAEESVYSLGYIYSLDGHLRTILHFTGGLKATPLILHEGDKTQLHYQEMLSDSLNRISLPPPQQ